MTLGKRSADDSQICSVRCVDPNASAGWTTMLVDIVFPAIADPVSSWTGAVTWQCQEAACSKNSDLVLCCRKPQVPDAAISLKHPSPSLVSLVRVLLAGPSLLVPMDDQIDLGHSSSGHYHRVGRQDVELLYL